MLMLRKYVITLLVIPLRSPIQIRKNPIIQHQCDVCKFQCKKEITLKKHKNTDHPNVSQKISVSTQGKSTMFHCDECNHSCKTKKSLKKYKTQDHQGNIKSQGIKCENCGKILRNTTNVNVQQWMSAMTVWNSGKINEKVSNQ